MKGKQLLVSLMIRNFLAILIAVITIGFSFSKESYAHPGATAVDGCHYCRTNCDKYGVAWNERHCHNGSPAPTVSQPSADPPTAPTVKETNKNEGVVQTPKTTTKPPAVSPKTNKTTKPVTKELNLTEDLFYKVTSVVDGDTIKVDADGKSATIRLLGIDTPEMNDKRKLVRCFANKAKSKLTALILGKEVKLKIDSTQGNKDKYSRFLRYVYLNDGTFVNLGLVKDGYAYSYRKYPTKYLSEFNNAEKEAREKKTGLWGKVCQ